MLGGVELGVCMAGSYTRNYGAGDLFCLLTPGSVMFYVRLTHITCYVAVVLVSSSVFLHVTSVLA